MREIQLEVSNISGKLKVAANISTAELKKMEKMSPTFSKISMSYLNGRATFYGGIAELRGIWNDVKAVCFKDESIKSLASDLLTKLNTVEA